MVCGINKFFISSGWNRILNDHLITSDLNLKSESDIIHYKWSCDQISLEGFELEELVPHLSFMEHVGLIQMTLEDLLTHHINLV